MGRDATQVVQMTGDGARPVDAPAPAARPRGSLVLPDVFLLKSSADGVRAVPHLALVLDPAGLNVLKPDGAPGALVPWNEVRKLTAAGRMRTPSGTPGVVVEAATAARTHRFLVPTDDTEGLQLDVTRAARSLARRSARRTPASPSPVPVVVLAVLLAGMIALIVLLIVGTVKF